MWILIVLSSIANELEAGEPVKMTYYDAYQTELKCNIQRLVLGTTFKHGEVAVCIQNRVNK